MQEACGFLGYNDKENLKVEACEQYKIEFWNIELLLSNWLPYLVVLFGKIFGGDKKNISVRAKLGTL